MFQRAYLTISLKDEPRYSVYGAKQCNQSLSADSERYEFLPVKLYSSKIAFPFENLLHFAQPWRSCSLFGLS